METNYIQNPLPRLKPHLTQLSSLMDILKKDEALQKHFQLADFDFNWHKIEKITLRQYKFIIALIMQKERFKLNELMLSLGFKRKI